MSEIVGMTTTGVIGPHQISAVADDLLSGNLGCREQDGHPRMTSNAGEGEGERKAVSRVK